MVEQPVHNYDQPVYKLTVGRVIATLRKAARISQEDFADAIGLSQPTLSRIERGEAIPDVATFSRIAVRLDLTPADLYNLIDNAVERAGQAAAAASSQAADSESQWSTVLKIAGVVGVAGLVAFAVAAVLNDREKERENEEAHPGSRRSEA